jgi:hypothetical protein
MDLQELWLSRLKGLHENSGNPNPIHWIQFVLLSNSRVFEPTIGRDVSGEAME